MKRSFSIKLTFTVVLDDWSVIFYDQNNNQIAQWNTESWEQWQEHGCVYPSPYTADELAVIENDVVNHAIELYKNSFSS